MVINTMIDQLIETYYSRVYAFALVHVISEHIAKDLTQDVFLQLIKREKELAAIDDIEAYIFTVTRNRTYKYFKKIKNNLNIQEEILTTYDEKYVDVEESIIANDLKEKLNTFIDRLPDRQREIYRMSREKGLSYKEIASELDISPHTVRNHLAQTLKTLKLNYHLFLLVILSLFILL